MSDVRPGAANGPPLEAVRRLWETRPAGQGAGRTATAGKLAGGSCAVPCEQFSSKYRTKRLIKSHDWHILLLKPAVDERSAENVYHRDRVEKEPG